ncbi:MAG: hypothetical protein MJD61_04065, partial [Proteobacteria bacterium]|nr:hypothetical protein [Pseudomonadota bacterium]
MASTTSPSLPAALLADLVPVEPPLREADLPQGIARTDYETQDSGQTPGSFAVTHLGQASYTIPIEVPPGRLGLQPNLALHYSSSAGTNYMGVGWSLQGLGMITRCKRIPAIDGYTPYDENGAGDHFCLGGERLVIVDPSKEYGADDVEYRTETDLFTKIVSKRPAGWTSPFSFEVSTRDGRTLRYITKGRGWEAWPLQVVKDKIGNFMNVSWHSSEKGAQNYRPSAVFYNYSSTNPAATYDTYVTFHYELRPDLRSAYGGGHEYRREQRLTEIKTFVGKQQIREYRLSYQTSGGLSVLDQVVECARKRV